VKHWDLEGDLFLRINDLWMRLRKSTLSKHSEWFSDVFAAIEEGRLMPDPKRSYMDGNIILVDVKNVQRCFHVPALGVTAMDFDLLLTALENAMYVSKPQCLISLLTPPLQLILPRASSVSRHLGDSARFH
jgi:hypothetical protein